MSGPVRIITQALCAVRQRCLLGGRSRVYTVNHSVSRLLSLVAAAAVAGCTTGQPRPTWINRALIDPDPTGNTIYMQPVEPNQRTVVSKDYALGARRVAAVGEPIVGVRNYTATDVVVDAIAIRDFRQLCYSPTGALEIEAASYTAEPAYAVDADASAEATAAAPAAEASVSVETDVSAEHRAGAYGRTTSTREPSTTPSAGPGLFGKWQQILGAPVADVSAQQEAAGRQVVADTEVEGMIEAGAEPPKAEAGASAQPSADTEIQFHAETETPKVEIGKPPEDERLSDLYCRRGTLKYVYGHQGDRFPIAGAFTENERMYYLVQLPAPGGDLMLAADDAGRLKGEPYAAWRDEGDTTETRLGVPLRYQTTKVPLELEGPLFRYEHREAVVAGGGSQNFDLIYRGTSYDHRGLIYHVLYREYDRTRATDPIYVQDLAYSGQTNTLDVLGMRIHVHDISDAHIIYTIQDD